MTSMLQYIGVKWSFTMILKNLWKGGFYMQDEKRKALESVFGQIEKQYGQGAVMRLGEKTSVEVE